MVPMDENGDDPTGENHWLLAQVHRLEERIEKKEADDPAFLNAS